MLDQLRPGGVPAFRSPKFVFAHIISPHPPFVLGSQGEAVHRADTDLAGYRDQVLFLNRQLETILPALIAASDPPPIIILQADHGRGGPSMWERMAILNALYLPGVGEQLLYPEISPVNTFRVIFNAYFDADYTLLEDTSYHSTYQAIYRFELVPETRLGCWGNLGAEEDV